MKKALQVNINGNIFFIDEDAYNMLQNYLHQLSATFTESDGKEIVDDIECRIGELFGEKIAAGSNVISIQDVNHVIDRMGRPEEINDEKRPSNDEKFQSSKEDLHKKADDNDDDDDDDDDDEKIRIATVRLKYENGEIKKSLYRNLEDKVLGGVVGGLAKLLEWDATIMRVLLVLILCIPYFWPTCIIYLIAWMIIPPANTPRRRLEMMGIPITIDNIGQRVRTSMTPPPFNGNKEDSAFKSLINTAMEICGKAAIGFVGFMAGCISLCMSVCVVILLASLAGMAIFGIADFAEIFSIKFGQYPVMQCFSVMFCILSVLIPGIALVWGAGSVLFKWKGASKSMVIVTIILEIVFIAVAVISTYYLKNHGALAENIFPYVTAWS